MVLVGSGDGSDQLCKFSQGCLGALPEPLGSISKSKWAWPELSAASPIIKVLFHYGDHIFNSWER